MKNLNSVSLLETVLFGSSNICPVTGATKSSDATTSRAGIVRRADVLLAIEEVKADITKAFSILVLDAYVRGEKPEMCCICGESAEHKLCPSCHQIFGNEMVAKIDAQIAKMKQGAKRLPEEVFTKVIKLAKELILENTQATDKSLVEQISIQLNVLKEPVAAAVAVAKKQIAIQVEKEEVFNHAVENVRKFFSGTSKVDFAFLAANPIEFKGSKVGESLYRAAGRQVEGENFERWKNEVLGATREIVARRFSGHIDIKVLIAEAPMWQGRKISEKTLKTAAEQVHNARKREKKQWETEAKEKTISQVREQFSDGKRIDDKQVTGLKHNDIEIPSWMIKEACKALVVERLVNNVQRKAETFFFDDVKQKTRVTGKTAKNKAKKAARMGR